VTWKKVLEAQKRQEREQALPIPVVFPYVDMEEETEADRATDNNIKIGINMAKVDLETKLAAILSRYHREEAIPFPDLGFRLQAALRYATEMHKDQHRKGTDIPYVSHLYSVASLIMEAGGSENEVIAGLLHDTVEDQGGAQRLREIDALFGSEVAAIVEGCTDDMPEPGEEKRPWIERKTAYIEHLKTAPYSVRLVSNADKLHNARSILSDLYEAGESVWGRFSQPRDRTLWYYRALADEFARAPASERLSRELSEVINKLETLSMT